jgi:hypothetical protein
MYFYIFMFSIRPSYSMRKTPVSITQNAASGHLAVSVAVRKTAPVPTGNGMSVANGSNYIGS